jgi:hypothetical protein
VLGAAASLQGKPAARKVIVVTPATLTNNWAKEVNKWLGNERLQALVLGAGAEGAQKVQDFKYSFIYKVLITGWVRWSAGQGQPGGAAGGARAGAAPVARNRRAAHDCNNWPFCLAR